jgi:hypothetical protein
MKGGDFEVVETSSSDKAATEQGLGEGWIELGSDSRV